MKLPENPNNGAGAVVQERLVRRLVDARENLRWTQSDLAKATGLQPAAISHFECGQRLPSIPNLLRLADALRVSTDWLLGRHDCPPKKTPVVEIDGVPYYPSPNDERMHLYQRGRTSIAGLRLKLREIIETGRLVEVVMSRLVLLDFYSLEPRVNCIS